MSEKIDIDPYDWLLTDQRFELNPTQVFDGIEQENQWKCPNVPAYHTHFVTYSICLPTSPLPISLCVKGQMLAIQTSWKTI